MTSAVERCKSRLYQVNALFALDDLEERLDWCRKTVDELTKDTSEKQAHDALSAAVSKSPQQHEEVCLGLLHVILTEPNSANNAYRDLNLVARDSMLLIVQKLCQLIPEKYIRLNDQAKSQLLWLTSQFVQSNVSGADAVCLALLKQAAGGDLSATNVWLVDSMLNLFTKNRGWLEKFPSLMAIAVYSYLRLIEDHSAGAYKTLRQREVNFCVSILRERFTNCMQIGRDLVRLLQNVSKIPEMKSLWKDLLHKPQTLCPQFTGIAQLLSVRTSRKFLMSRLTPDMENKIGFLTSKVKFGQQKRYQEWFQRQYLSQPESQSLRADLMRYICGVVHPTNEILGSDITPRWAVIGWLLSTCPNNVTAANSKLALFYDWLFYQLESDNVMNIEPGILVMFHSLRSHVQITTSLLDFLCRVSLEYCQQVSSRECVRNAFKTILEKKVIMSLMPIFEHPRMGPELKSLVRSTFPEFFHVNGSSGKISEELPAGKMDSFGADGIPSGILNFGGIGGDGHSDSDSAEGFNDAKFSDTDEEMDSQVNGEKNMKVKDSKFQPIVPEKASEEKDDEDEDEGDMVDFDELEKLDEDLRDLVLKLQQESNMGARCDTMESILALVVSLNDFDDEMSNALATCLNISLVEDYYRLCLPEKVTERELEESLESPLYTLFGKLIHLPVHDIGRETIVKLLQEMKAREPRLGYHLLYYLRASDQDEENLSVYEEFTKSCKDFKSISNSLLEDMKICQAYDPRLFVYLVPAMYRKFSKVLVGNGDMLHLMVSIVDPVQLKELLHEVVLRDLVIFGDGNLDAVLEKSLCWESYEQYNVWQLLCAEDPPVETFLNVLPLLKPNVHSEAMSNILLLLKGAELTSEIVSSLLCMDCPSSLKRKPKQQLSTCLLRYWSFDYSKELAKIICSHIEKILSTGNRRRQLKSTSQQPTMEQLLVQLECFYEVCQHHQNLDFFKQEMIKRSLEKVKQHCTDSVQKKFQLLFSVCEEQESRRRNNRMSKIVATQLAEQDSSSESEEEEEEPKKRTGKRKRKSSPDFASDSDD